jgi:hypothetical protein
VRSRSSEEGAPKTLSLLSAVCKNGAERDNGNVDIYMKTENGGKRIRREESGKFDLRYMLGILDDFVLLISTRTLALLGYLLLRIFEFSEQRRIPTIFYNYSPRRITLIAEHLFIIIALM